MSKQILRQHNILLFVFLFQGTFQAIVSTDGTVTFAVFVYEDELEVIDRIPFYQVGFASGEDHSFLNIVGREPASYTGELKKISAFRVDGIWCVSQLDS